MTALKLPPRPDAPTPAPWPGWSGVRAIRPGSALAAVVADATRRPSAQWPGWTGLLPSVDHTKHSGHRDREAKR